MTQSVENLHHTPQKENLAYIFFFFSFRAFVFHTHKAIDLIMYKKRKQPDEAWWSTKITPGLHTPPELPSLHGSNLFQLDMAAGCVASSLTHTSNTAQPVNRVMECI